MKSKNILKKVSLLVIIVILILLIGEIFVRIFYSQAPFDECNDSYPIDKSLTERDENLGWILKPNLIVCKYNENNEKIYFYTNDLNMRNKENLSITKVKKRIFMLGDSFLANFDGPHNESYSERLQYYLGSDYEVLNLGGSGYGTDQEIIRLGMDLDSEPDIVIMNIFGNDYSDNLNQGDIEKVTLRLDTGKSYLTREGDYFPFSIEDLDKYTIFLDGKMAKNDTKKEIKYNKINFILIQKSQFYRFIIKKIKNLKTFKKEEKMDYQIYSYFNLLKKNYDAVDNYSLVLGFRLFNDLEKFSKQKGFKVVFVYIPFRFQHDPDYYKDYLVHVFDIPSEDTFDKEKINRIQEEFMDKKNYYYIDLLPTFKNFTIKEIYGKGTDLHWSANGKDLAAKKLAEYLKEKNIVN